MKCPAYLLSGIGLFVKVKPQAPISIFTMERGEMSAESLDDLVFLMAESVREHSGGIGLPYKVKVDPHCSFCLKNRQIYLKGQEYEHPEPTFIKILPCSVAALSYEQDYPGRTVVILRSHETSMSHMLESELLMFVAFMEDVAAVADAIYKALKPEKVNYAVFMNQNYHFHMHLIPRYEWEGDGYQRPPVFRGTDKLDPAFDYRSLALEIRKNLPKEKSPFSERIEKMVRAGLPK